MFPSDEWSYDDQDSSVAVLEPPPVERSRVVPVAIHHEPPVAPVARLSKSQMAVSLGIIVFPVVMVLIAAGDAIFAAQALSR